MGKLITIISNRPINVDFGLLLIRLGVGLSMAGFHGWGKIAGGPERWAGIGGSMENVGIAFAPTMWGFMAAFAEFFCSILLILGVLFRPAAAMLAFTMIIAITVHLNMPADNPNAGWSGASHALELLCVYVGLMFAGAGRFSLIRSGKPSSD